MQALQRELAAAAQRAEQPETGAQHAQQAAASRGTTAAAEAGGVSEDDGLGGWEGGDLLSGDLLDFGGAGQGAAEGVSPALPATPTAAVLSNPAFSPDRGAAELHRQVGASCPPPAASTPAYKHAATQLRSPRRRDHVPGRGSRMHQQQRERTGG